MNTGALAILMVFGCPTAVLLVALYVRYRAMQARHRERMTAIEKGVSLEDLARLDAFPCSPGRIFLLRGLLWLLPGLALALCLLVLTPVLFDGPRTVAWLGIIPAAVGLAYLVFYWLEQRDGDRETARLPLSSGR